MIPNLIVIFSISTISTNVATVEDLFIGREPQGEYIYYLEANKSAALNQQKKNSLINADIKSNKPKASSRIIDANTYKLMFEVSTSFENDTKNIALSYIKDMKNNPERYSTLKSLLENKTAKDVFELIDLKTGEYILPIESNKNSASWIEFSHFNPSDQNYSMHIRFMKVEDERTLEIRGHNKFNELTIGELYSHWNKLVTKYENTPMKKFEHANNY
ncbi:hypothetical protein GCM10009133_04170 [Cocleimonas flava]|uniref:Uncharacterized protein n=1 Tax=Cocleimonas flava TaxID=634765 RepID=A0A4R1EY89_9GAMM|nr:hypothetical protein [Cocleimonas flava]TCJ86787.1 hypothetical protein EV695_1285 [Cocleimonas flava]